MKNRAIKFKLLMGLLLATSFIFAQPGGGGGGVGQGGPPPGSGNVPIDGGAILLAIGAAAYGRKMLSKKIEQH